MNKFLICFLVFLFNSVSQATEFAGVWNVTNQTCIYDPHSPITKCLRDRKNIEFKIISNQRIEGRSLDSKGNETEYWVFQTSYAHNPVINVSVISSLGYFSKDGFQWDYEEEDFMLIKNERYTLKKLNNAYELTIDRRSAHKNSEKGNFFIETMRLEK